MQANGPAGPAVDWASAGVPLAGAFFDGVRSCLQALDRREWPSRERLNALAAPRGICNTRGDLIRFVAPAALAASAMRYETRIAETGEVPTRDNWHDLFNALQWVSFPQMKAAINAQHAALLCARGEHEAKSRSVPRDVLTMVDESGVLAASEDDALLELIRQFRWRELFVDRREQVKARMRFVLVGHGLMEKALRPFIGLTGKAILLNISATGSLDAAAADWLRVDANLASSQTLAPLPLLGIPGWDARNEDPLFYLNSGYFRPGRRTGNRGRS